MNKLSPKQKEILQFLLDEKKRGNPYVYLQSFRRSTVIVLVDLDLIHASKSPIDKTRHIITKRGEQALLEANAPRFKYWFNGNGYETIQAMAEGENMSFHQARWRVQNGYTCEADKAHGGAVTVAGIRYNSVKEAAEILGYKPKSIRKIIAREAQPKTWKAVAKKSEPTKRYKFAKAFERLGIEYKREGESNA